MLPSYPMVGVWGGKALFLITFIWLESHVLYVGISSWFSPLTLQSPGWQSPPLWCWDTIQPCLLCIELSNVQSHCLHITLFDPCSNLVRESQQGTIDKQENWNSETLCDLSIVTQPRLQITAALWTYQNHQSKARGDKAYFWSHLSISDTLSI